MGITGTSVNQHPDSYYEFNPKQVHYLTPRDRQFYVTERRTPSKWLRFSNNDNPFYLRGRGGK